MKELYSLEVFQKILSEADKIVFCFFGEKQLMESRIISGLLYEALERQTWLTVYRSPYIRMPCQLVGRFPVERAIVSLDVVFPRFDKVYDLKLLANYQNADSQNTKASFRASECSK